MESIDGVEYLGKFYVRNLYTGESFYKDGKYPKSDYDKMYNSIFYEQELVFGDIKLHADKMKDQYILEWDNPLNVCGSIKHSGFKSTLSPKYADHGYIEGATVRQYNHTSQYKDAVIKHVHSNGGLDVEIDGEKYGWDVNFCLPVIKVEG